MVWKPVILKLWTVPKKIRHYSSKAEKITIYREYKPKTVWTYYCTALLEKGGRGKRWKVLLELSSTSSGIMKIIMSLPGSGVYRTLEFIIYLVLHPCTLICQIVYIFKRSLLVFDLFFSLLLCPGNAFPAHTMKIALYLYAVILTVVVKIVTANVLLQRSPQHYCGSRLADMMKLLCATKYNFNEPTTTKPSKRAILGIPRNTVYYCYFVCVQFPNAYESSSDRIPCKITFLIFSD